ncbi:hypothetical protein RJ639_009029 [Escallonia herrerae]|uniref:Integrase catalytic domain-containing protein n=1 Tax=Escallonia herrerae TaxID=1293975 RepID=A0AA88VVC4_9ASTE|nr:hypothetical protein RJ639_009029 [Escallonia herrerae]
MAEEGKGKIDKFNGMNFQWWKMQVEDCLYQNDLYLQLVGEKPEAINAKLQKNLISVSGLDREGYFVAFGEKQWKWKALVEHETGNKIKCLKSDNGGEYRDEEFQEFCSNNGIRLIRTVKRTPQENGLAKRMNKTIMERARVFIYIAYAHIDKEERKKLNSKSQKCVFIGYQGDEYGYHLWDYEHNKIIRSKDVIFDKSRLYKYRLQEHVIEKENKEYMELDEPEDGQVPRTENPEVLDETTDTEFGTGD